MCSLQPHCLIHLKSSLLLPWYFKHLTCSLDHLQRATFQFPPHISERASERVSHVFVLLLLLFFFFFFKWDSKSRTYNLLYFIVQSNVSHVVIHWFIIVHPNIFFLLMNRRQKKNFLNYSSISRCLRAPTDHHDFNL